MALPGFVAEASLKPARAWHHARRTWEPGPAGGRLLLAYTDLACLDACYGACNEGCFGLSGSARGACLRRCQSIQENCTEACTVPDPISGGHPLPQTVLEDLIMRGYDCLLYCTSDANSWFERITAEWCWKLCMIAGPNR